MDAISPLTEIPDVYPDWTLLFIILLCAILVYYWWNSWMTYFDDQEQQLEETIEKKDKNNNSNNDNIAEESSRETFESEQPSNKSQPRHTDEGVVYIFWTGGFDSNFLIAQRLIEEKKNVQPIYLAFKCDTKPDGKYYRRNRKQEMKAMRRFRDIVNRRYPWTMETFLPTLYVKDVPDDPYFTRQYINMKLFPRDISQYKHMAMYAHATQRRVEIGSIGLDANITDKYGKYLRQNLVMDEQYPSKMAVYKHRDNQNPLHNMRYPLIYLTKKHALKQAQLGGYSDLLEISWSCWFPKEILDPEDGLVKQIPCEKCPMCRQRIIDHPNN